MIKHDNKFHPNYYYNSTDSLLVLKCFYAKTALQYSLVQESRIN